MKNYNNITATEARNTTVYTFDEHGVFSVSLFDHVMKSLDYVNTPQGLKKELFVEPQPEGRFAVIAWHSGCKLRIAELMETEAEADTFLFQKVFDYDFDRDDQRNTSFFYTEAEAVAAYAEAYSE